MDEPGHPRGEKPGDAVGRELAVVDELLQAHHVDLLAFHQRRDAVGRDGGGPQAAEPIGVERRHTDVMGPFAVEIGQLDHRRDVTQIERQRCDGHQRHAPLAAEKPPDERREVQQQDDGHQQGDRSPEIPGFGRNERRTPTQYGCGQQQDGKNYGKPFEQIRYSFLAHKVYYFDLICLFPSQR